MKLWMTCSLLCTSKTGSIHILSEEMWEDRASCTVSHFLLNFHKICFWVNVQASGHEKMIDSIWSCVILDLKKKKQQGKNNSITEILKSQKCHLPTYLQKNKMSFKQRQQWKILLKERNGLKWLVAQQLSAWFNDSCCKAAIKSDAFVSVRPSQEKNKTKTFYIANAAS